MKWEYKVVDLIKGIKKVSTKKGLQKQWLYTSDLEKILNKFGLQGWELVHIHFFLEREEEIIVGLFKRAF